MANPYEWSDDDRARHAAQRHAEQERMQPPRRHPGDHDAGWYGEDAPRDGYDARGPYGRAGEQPDRRHAEDRARGEDAAFYERYGEPEAYRRANARHERMEEDHRGHGPEHRSFEEEARRAGQGIARGWRRLTEGARHTLHDDRGPAEHDPRRAGGMFGGRDRPGSLFNHDDGLGLSGRPGAHRGKGPKGYVRGDERILEEVCDRLTEDGGLDASDIEVKVEAGEVTLNGQVKRREDKRRAEDVAESVSGVKHLQNNIRVRAPAPPPEPAQPAARQAAPRPAAQPAAQAARRVGPEPAAPTSAQITDQRAKPATPRPRAPRPN